MKHCIYRFWVAGGIFLWSIAATTPAQAQIFTDGTTKTNLLQGQGCTICDIHGTTTAGGNLFHSFSQFSIPPGGRVRFINDNPVIQNAIARVTGSFPSNINGSIEAGGTNPNFNLFLINPNGIIFGQGASLQLNGSFVASTAKSVVFADGTQFVADSPPTAPLLTVSVPIGLQFGATAAPIQVQESGLFMPSGKTLALLGGDVTMQGGLIVAPSGRIELGSVAPNSRVNLKAIATGFALDYANVQNFQNIELSQEAIAIVEAGDLQVRGRNVTLTGGSGLAVNPSGTHSGGTLDITASESELIGTSNSGTPSGLFAQTTSARNAGNIAVTTKMFIVRDGALVFNSTGGTGRGGEITINASDLVELSSSSSSSGLFSQSLDPAANGKGGNISITTARLVVGDRAFVSASTDSKGGGGNLTVDASQSVELSGNVGGIISGLSTQTNGAGDAGILKITTPQLTVRDGRK